MMQSYIDRYTGHTKLHRLLYIGSVFASLGPSPLPLPSLPLSPSVITLYQLAQNNEGLRDEALILAERIAKTTINTNMYNQIIKVRCFLA